MSRKVLKYRLNLGETFDARGQTIKVPGLERVLKVDTQGLEIFFWAIGDMHRPHVNVDIVTYHTGSELPDLAKAEAENDGDFAYVNSVQLDRDTPSPVVVHVFMRSSVRPISL